MGLFSAIGSAFGPVGTVVGGLLDSRQASKAQKQASAAASQEAELAYQRSLPWDVTGMFGTAKFDEGTKELTMGLAPEWQTEYEKALTGAEAQRGYISGIEADPWTAGQKFYEQQKALYAPEQEQQRLELEKRLLAQGMLGSTGGSQRMQALLEAQATQDLQAQAAGLDKAQTLIDLYRARTAEELGMAETIGHLPQKYAETGRGIGTGMSTIAEAAAKRKSAAAQSAAASKASLFMGDQFKGLFDSSSFDFGTPSTPVDYNSSNYSYFNI